MSKTSLPKKKIKILLLEGVHQSAVDILHNAGYTNIEYHETALSRPDLLEIIKDVHFIGIRSRTHLDQEVLEAAEKLVGIGCFCIGTNQVDTKAAMLRGIPVFNAPFSNTRSVAELVIAEIIMLLRDIPKKNWMAHDGLWHKSAKNSFEMRGKRLGIIGYGNIGSQLSILAESLGMQVYYYDIAPKLPLGNVKKTSSLEDLLKKCDVISLHVPETPKTQGLIGEKELSLMKEGSILINASRGSVVECTALAKYLKNDRLRGAALDVHPKEPKNLDERFESPLRGIKNVILTPHVGGSTEEAQKNIGKEVAQKMVEYSDTGSTIGAVNFPQVSLASHPHTHRLLHIHKNLPGILSKINHVFSDNDINISAQYLQTNASIGYVVIHVDKEYSKFALEKLQKIEGTIRTRVLY